METLPILCATDPARPAGGDIVFSSGVRFFRDLAGVPFDPALVPPRARTALVSRVAGALRRDFLRVRWSGAGLPLRRLLRAAGWLDRESEERRAAVFRTLENDCAVLVGGTRTVCIVSTRPGQDLRGAYALASAADDAVAAAVPYAFWPAAGYLARRPEEVGLGFSAEATLHLAATAELLDPETWEGTLAAAEKLGFEAEAAPAAEAWSSGRPSGFVKFAAVPADGESEEDVLARTEGLVEELVSRETALREHLLRDPEARGAWSERVHRFRALAAAAEKSDAAEVFGWLANLRLPACLGLPWVDRAALERGLLLSQPLVSRDDTRTPEEWAALAKEPLLDPAPKTKKAPVRRRKSPPKKKKETGE